MSWDLFGKALLKECAQDFVTYFVPGARYVGMRECQFQTRTNGPFKPREMRGDGVLEAERDGENLLMEVEWQSTRDMEIGDRLLGYNFESTRLHKLPTLSVVVNLRPVNDPSRGPLVYAIPGRPVPGGSPVLVFNYVSLEIGNIPVEELRALNLDGFTALTVLCKGGDTTAVLQEALDRLLLRKEQRKEAIAATLFFASMVFTSESDKQFLERKCRMLEEILEDNWIFQRFFDKGITKGIAEGRAEGLEQGIAEGRAEGRAEEARQIIGDFVMDRFPALFAWVEGQVGQISDLELLRKILRVVSKASTPEEVKAAFPVQH